MTSRKFIFGGLLVVFSLAFVLFLVRCSFTSVELPPDMIRNSDITMVSTVSTETQTTSRPRTTTQETSTTCTTPTELTTNVSTECTVLTTYQQTVVNVETTLSKEDVAEVTTITQTTSHEMTTCSETTTQCPFTDKRVKIDMGFRGSFYTGGWCTGGGSGRTLLPYNTTDEIRGSVASYYLWNRYKYDFGGRTKIYIEVPQFPEMNGYYYLDDCCSELLPNTIDFFCYDSNPCPLMLPIEKPIGVTFDIQCWIVEE